MLPPFRVRTLRPSADPGLGRSKSKEFNALVRITAPEYDKTVRVCPEASLKYLDEEDGETVTVWTRASIPYCLVLIEVLLQRLVLHSSLFSALKLLRNKILIPSDSFPECPPRLAGGTSLRLLRLKLSTNPSFTSSLDLLLYNYGEKLRSEVKGYTLLP